MISGSRRRCILLVTNWIGWAGAERQLEHLAIGLSRAGHSVVLLATGSTYADVELIEAAGVKVVTLEASNRLAKIRAVRRIASYARAADIVHCTGWDATLWGRLGAILARRPVVITEHTPGRDAQVASTGGVAGTGVIALHNRLLDRFTYAAIAVGAWQRELLESEGVRASAIVHIPNAVPVDALRMQAQSGPGRVALGISEESLIVIQVARFAPQKGQATTLRVVSRLRERLGDVRVLYVGEGSGEDAVKREAEAIGAGWASFLGFRDDVAGLLDLADLSVLPSTGEGLPMSLIETIAVGTPIVATDVGDVRWFIETTGAGVCVEPGDEEAFFDACAQILGDPAMRAEMAAAGTKAAADFDAPKMVGRYEQVFEAAIEKAPLP